MSANFLNYPFKEWNEQALFPGPQELEEDYIKRAQFCLELDKNLSQKLDVELPFNSSDLASKDILNDSCEITKKKFGIAPNWVPLFFNNYQLSSWQGGCAWIFQLNESTPTAAFLQLRAQFKKNQSYLGLYNRNELIAHEIVHVGRMMYQEPKFEEILAYQTSSKIWRKWLGPIVQSHKESLFFVLLLGFVIIGDAALITLGKNPVTSIWSFWIKLLPLTLIGLGLIRLGLRQYQFHCCLKKLKSLYPDKEQEIVYRLEDSEIKKFASMPISNIRVYIKKQESFRWQFLKYVYH